MSFDWKKTLGAVAPSLATALAGPAAGAAIKVLAGKFLGKEEAEEDEIAEAVLTASPEQLANLKQIDYQFRRDMAQLGVDLERINASDRQNARELAKSKGMAPQIILSTIYTIGYMWVLWAFVSGHAQVPEESKSQFDIVLGVLTAAQIQIMNYWFGSSSGSKQKTEALGGKS